jgi:hypothetical protein
MGIGTRITTALAGLAVAGAAAAVGGTAAQAEPASSLPVGQVQKTAVRTGTAPTGRAQAAATPKLPPNAVRTDRTSYRLGATGPAFQSQVSTRIVNGSLANVTNHRYIVGLRSIFWLPNSQGGFDGWVSTCTGTVISSTKILTAAHCTVDLPHGTTYVIAGRNNLDDETGGYVAEVASTWTHQSYGAYNGAPRHDVAVLTLKQALPNVYTPIAVAPQGTEYADLTSGSIVGYGVTASGAGNSGILRAATVPLRLDSACTSALGSGYENASMVCAGNPQAGIDTCNGDSGGPLIVGGVEVGVTSWGPNPCGQSYGVYTQVSTYSNLIAADLARAAPANLDWTGDGHSDLIGRTPGGALYQYYGTGLNNAGHSPIGGSVAQIGAGWGGFTKLLRVSDWNGDRTPSIVARTANGDLFQYRSDGAGNFTTGQAERIGNGWNGFNDIMVTSNWTGNGLPNLIGRTATGDMYLYTSNGAGGWLNGGTGIKIGNGWNAFDTILTPGPWLGDGKQALIGRTPGGDLRLYQSNGQGGWVNGSGVVIGTGWNSFTRFMSPGDLNGDNMADMIGIHPNGNMLLYTSDGHGNWLNGGLGAQIGSGWNGFTALF